MTSLLRVPFVDLKAQYHAIADEIQAAISRVLERADFVLGEELERLEAEFAAYIGVEHAVGVGSGLAALELALRAYEIGPGDEVITAANTYIATVLAIMAVGARPVLVDIEPTTYNLSPAAVEACVTSHTRVIMPVHLYGQAADMDSLMAIAERHHLLVIEDAAQAHGACYRGKRVGAFGHAAGFSFYPGKNLGAYGDGGMVVTRDAAVAEKVRQLRNYGQRLKYHHDLPGTNSRLDTLQAAILQVKLRHLDEWNAGRRAHAVAYARLLEALPVLRPVEIPEAKHIYHLYVIQIEGRDQVRSVLQTYGVETGIHYPLPVHLQKACASLGHRPGAFPVTEAAVGKILSLPMFAELTEGQLEHVAHALSQAFQRQPSFSGVN
jgi:dTDP-4-amino-4,6-dideoxygalactose transaminase